MKYSFNPAVMQHARDIMSGKIKAKDPAERDWAKQMTYTEHYGMGERKIGELINATRNSKETCGNE